MCSEAQLPGGRQAALRWRHKAPPRKRKETAHILWLHTALLLAGPRLWVGIPASTRLCSIPWLAAQSPAAPLHTLPAECRGPLALGGRVVPEDSASWEDRDLVPPAVLSWPRE